MHYIVGTQFVKSGMQLSLYHIVRKGDKIVYTFTDTGTGKNFDMEFGSTREADIYMANARGESLPDYDNFYSKSN